MIQGTQEWKQARCGKVTASRVADVIARTKAGYGASRNTYMGELIAERLTGVPAESYTNGAMQWGIDHEGDAADAYAFYAGVELDTIGFVEHPTIPMAGASPDRLVAADGLIEIKCPNTSTHIETLLSKSVPGKYLTQMHWQMACTGRQWCDFVSFDPRMPESLRLFVKRVQRDNAEIERLENEVRTFLAELDGKIVALMGKAA